MNKLKRVIWFGNAFYDNFHIIKNDKFIFKQVAGGIKNCRIEGMDNCYESGAYGIADFLLSDKQKESTVKFYGIDIDEAFLAQYCQASWLHIAYIDALAKLDLSKVDRKRFPVISCDFCHPKKEIVEQGKILQNLKYCDYIFNNQHKTWYDGILGGKTEIVHDETGSVVMCGYNQNYGFVVKKEKYLFTVGAGDRFAAAFIEARLNNAGLQASQKFAHEKVGKWLEEVNKAL